MGDVRAVTYEYRNTFLIVAGLLNLLVVIDAYDMSAGSDAEPPAALDHLRVLRVAGVRPPLGRTARALRFGGTLFAGFVVAALVLGWLIYPFPYDRSD
jgi:hypothetical protein